MRLRFASIFVVSLFNPSSHKSSFLLQTHLLKTQCHRPEPPISSSFSSSSSILHSCEELQALKEAHALLVVSNSFEPVSIASKLISLYAHFGDLESALAVFEAVQEPSTVAWNSIVKAHVDWSAGDSAFWLYRRMRKLGVEHDGFTLPILNKAILLLQNGILYRGIVHCLGIKMGFESDVCFSNTTMDVYAKCGYTGSACQLFEEMSHRDLVSWTSMISGYVYVENMIGAFKLFHKMRLELEPGPVTMLVLIQASCSSGSLVEGKQLHGFVIRVGFLIHGSLRNSILKMYANIGTVDEAENFFSEIHTTDVVSWNILIASYISREDVEEVAGCFNRMQSKVRPSIQTLTLVISASAKSGDLSQGERMHGFAIKTGLFDSVLQTSLLDFYAKSGDLEKSARMFFEIPFKNSVTRNAMMSGYIAGGHFKEAIELFRQMQDLGLELGADILSNLVVMYAYMGALQLGKGIHGYCIKNLFSASEEDYAALETSILNMYIRCGSISSARICFSRIAAADLVTWTSMIEGFGSHGLGAEALQLFHQMMGEGLEPNSVTFLSLLSACSHSGLLNEGCGVFHWMKRRFGIEPGLNHYTCIVDLLCRSGKLKEALALILRSVSSPDGRIWGAFLSACRVYGNQKLGEFVAHRLLQLETDNAGYYTLLSNLQAIADRWTEVEDTRRCMKENDLMKKPGWSCIEAKGSVHGFVSGDRSHPQMVEIYEAVEVLSRKIHEFGLALDS